MQISILTHKCSLVPAHFFNPDCARDSLAQVFDLSPSDSVQSVYVPAYDSYLLYADGPDYERVLDENLPDDGNSQPCPEMFRILSSLSSCPDYNKILCSLRDGYLYLAIGQGNNLLLCNVYRAQSFTTAQYFILLALKSLQMNPEISTVCLRTPVGAEDEMSLYRYFKAVELVG